MRSIKTLAKPYIVGLKEYSSARSEYTSGSAVWLDANENNLGNTKYGQLYNRYPDPTQQKLKSELCKGLQGVVPSQVFVGNGSDEALDLLFRVFVESGSDAIAVCSPTYGMYKVLADSYNSEVLDVPLNKNFQLDVPALLGLPKNCKILFLCSPNNPTGNDLKVDDVEKVLSMFDGIVVMDEAYIHFSEQASWVNRLDQFPNLVVTQTFSKAHGLAGLRVGMAFGSEELIALLNKVKLPYNMNTEVLRLAESYVQNYTPKELVNTIVEERNRVSLELQLCAKVDCVYPSSANFILFTCSKSQEVYLYLRNNGVIIRNRQNDYPNALRVSIGSAEENNKFLSLFNTYYAK
jgi:histidinol-phosphate aminotransferase